MQLMTTWVICPGVLQSAANTGRKCTNKTGNLGWWDGRWVYISLLGSHTFSELIIPPGASGRFFSCQLTPNERRKGSLKCAWEDCPSNDIWNMTFKHGVRCSHPSQSLKQEANQHLRSGHRLCSEQLLMCPSFGSLQKEPWRLNSWPGACPWSRGEAISMLIRIGCSDPHEVITPVANQAAPIKCVPWQNALGVRMEHVI